MSDTSCLIGIHVRTITLNLLLPFILLFKQFISGGNVYTVIPPFRLTVWLSQIVMVGMQCTLN